MSDTEVFRKNTPQVQIWELREEHKSLVLSHLAKICDDVDTGSIAESFQSIARQMAGEYYEDNSREIRYRVEGSLLEDLDDDNLRVSFVEAVSSSMAYLMMARCGFDTDLYFSDEDFMALSDFNTPDVIHALGEATSDLSQQVLRDVELVVKKYERGSIVKSRSHRHVAGFIGQVSIRNLGDDQLALLERLDKYDREIKARDRDIHRGYRFVVVVGILFVLNPLAGVNCDLLAVDRAGLALHHVTDIHPVGEYISDGVGVPVRHSNLLVAFVVAPVVIMLRGVGMQSALRHLAISLQLSPFCAQAKIRRTVGAVSAQITSLRQSCVDFA